MSFRPLPVLTLCTLASLALLMWLGNWQYTKYKLKLGQVDTPEVWESFSGTVQGDGEAIVYSFHKGQSAWRRVRPVMTDDRIVFTTVEIIYSIEPPSSCSVMDCPESAPFSAEGVFLRPARGFGAAQEDTANGVFYQYHPDRLGERLPDTGGLKVSDTVFEPRDVILTEGNISKRLANPLARKGRGIVLSPERHFGYAITWWGLAIALLVMYFVFHHARGRLSFKSEDT